MKKKLISIISITAIILLFIFVLFNYQNKNQIEMSYNEFVKNVNNNLVKEVILRDSSNIKVKLDDSKKIYIVPNPRSKNFKEYLLLNDIKVIEDDTANIFQIIQAIIFLMVSIIVFWYMQKRMGANSIKNQIKMEYKVENNKNIKFDDVAGNAEAKESVKELVDFIKRPEKYTKYGARMPRGVIFCGPPGTGKTLMAKAIAGEAGVDFFAVSGSDFVQMYVGVGASRVRDLFKKAREAGKAVIFIDEIDALGRKRDSQVSSNDERDQTLNALLTEMSGFNSNEGIIVIAATNRLDILDSALLRPGRFDRQIEIGLPDVNAREKILRLHSKNKPLCSDVDLKKIARQTVYFSGAMLENLLNEAAIFAAKDNNKYVEYKHVDKAYYTIIAGSEKKDKSSIREQDRRITSYHEAGHTLVTKLIAPNNSVSKVTIIPSSKGAGGFSMNIPPDKMYHTKKDMEVNIMISLAGRAAEEIIFGEEEITTGASNDIEKATQMIKDYVIKYGMSEKIGLLNMSVLAEGKNIENDIVEECRNKVSELYSKTKEIIIENKYYLNNIAEALLVMETLEEEDINAVLNGEDILVNNDMEDSYKIDSKLIKKSLKAVNA